MGKILLIPIGGLANRMRAVASAVALASEKNDDLMVLWQKDDGLNADFSDIFETRDLPFKLMSVSPFVYNFFYEMPRKKNFFIPPLLHSFSKRKWYIHSRDKALVTTDDDFRQLTNHYNNLVIMSCYDFFPTTKRFSKIYLDQKKLYWIE